MSSEPAFRRVIIEAFRGFRDRQEFDIAASVVIVAGPNGTGKTSLFDALQWALIGRIERLESVRARPTVEHVVNQYRLDSSASVEIEMTVGDREFRIRRTGDHRRSTLEFVDAGGALFGDEAQSELEKVLAPNPGITLEMGLTTSGLLQQDVMRAALQARPADRYRHVSTVLGLSELEDVEDALKDAAKRAADVADGARNERDNVAGSLEAARARLQRSQVQQLQRAALETVLEDLNQLLSQAPAGLRITAPQPVASEGELASLAREFGRVADQLDSVRSNYQALTNEAASLDHEPNAEDLAVAQDELRVTENDLADSTAALQAAEAALNAARNASQEIARLAAAAIPLLATECPVCRQAIDPAAVEAELRTRAAATETLLSLQRAVDGAASREDAAKTNYQEAVDALDSLTSIRDEWTALNDRRAALGISYAALTAAQGPVYVVAGGLNALADLAPVLVEYLSAGRRRLLEAADLLAQSSATGLVERSAAEVASFEEALAARNRRVEELAQRATLLKNLADAAITARVEVTEQRFRAIQPLVADIFSRLDPHPAFKTIEFELDTYYRRGTTSPLVRDVVEDVLADPLVIFSTSQANIAALSYFLAMGWTAGDRSMPFVLLDDPLQSMDDVNVLGFADLCRHIKSSRQLMISTHERRLSGLLERKLAPRDKGEQTLLFEFVAWDRSGPTVERRFVDPQLVESPIRLVRAAS